LAERVKDYTKTCIVNDSKKLAEKLKSPLYKRDSALGTEEGDEILEVIMDPRRVQDRKPVHAGVAILQHSKLMLLNFVDFLRKYLKKGSYALVYGGRKIQKLKLF